MPALGFIREKIGVIVTAFIFVSLAAFILGSFVTSGSSVFGEDPTLLGELNGENISYNEYDFTLRELQQQYEQQMNGATFTPLQQFQIRAMAWDTLVKRRVINQIVEELPVELTKAEWGDLMLGNSPHPLIMEIFRNPQTGAYDPIMVRQFIESHATNPEAYPWWNNVERSISEQTINARYRTLLMGGIYSNSLEKNQQEQNQQYEVDIIYQPNYMIKPTGDVSPSDEDAEATYRENKGRFYKERSEREIKYLALYKNPTEKDFATVEAELEALKLQFKESGNDGQFVAAYSDRTFDNQFFKYDTLPATMGEELKTFIKNGKISDLYGPIREEDSYTLSKISKIVSFPDSIQLALLPLPLQSQEQIPQLLALSDSLTKAINEGADYVSLIDQYAQNQQLKDKKGDIGWVNFNEISVTERDSLFFAPIGYAVAIPSQQGINIYIVTNKGEANPKVQIATLTKNVNPSDETLRSLFDSITQVAVELSTLSDLESAQQSSSLNIKTDVLRPERFSIQADKFLYMPQPELAPELVDRAFQTGEGEVIKTNSGSSIFNLENSYVFGFVSRATDIGQPSLEEARKMSDFVYLLNEKARARQFLEENNLSETIDMDTASKALGIPASTEPDFLSSTYVQNDPSLGLFVKGMQEGETAMFQSQTGIYFISVKKVSSVDPVPMMQMNNDARMVQSIPYSELATLWDFVDKHEKILR